MTQREALQALRRQAILFAALGITVLLGGYYLVGPESGLWPFLAIAILLYFFAVLWRSLPQNHRPDEENLFPDLGLANALTLLRAVLMAAFCGFLLSARPPGAGAWLPGVLYTLASLPDFVDGIIARKTGRTTRLGETLDMTVDSVGVLAASLLSVQYGVVPWWYLPIGLARYLFVFGILLRERAGRPVHELPFSHRRRGFAALKMGFMFVMLFPLFGPPGTYVAAAAFGLPFAIAFTWDWLIVSGRINPLDFKRWQPAGKLALAYVPVFLRILAVLLLLPTIRDHLADPGRAVLGGFEALAAIFLAAGILPRPAAIVAVCLSGVNQNLNPLSSGQLLLIVVYIALVLAGGGRFCLLPLEDRLIYHRIGDPA